MRPSAQANFLWLALAVALSPSLVELIRHWADDPWSRASSLFVPLAIGAARADRRRATPNGDGWLVVAVAVLLPFGGVATGFPRVGRLAIPLAVVGMARVLGHPSLYTATIACFVVPLPASVANGLSPQLELRVIHVVVAMAGIVGIHWSLAGSTIVTAGGPLRLAGTDMGLPLAHLLAGLGWCAAARRPSAAPFRALRWTLWALPAELIALVAAFACLALVGADVARGFLDLVPPLVVTVLGLLRLRYGARAHSPCAGVWAATAERSSS